MISSMTAFAREQTQGDWGSLVCEIRSINHRFLEPSVYLPESLRVVEMAVRELIRGVTQRGKIECVVRLKLNPAADAAMVSLNTPLVKALCKANEAIAGLLAMQPTVSTTDIMRFPGVLETKEADMEMLQAQTLKTVEKCLKELVEARQREGQELSKLFLQRIDAIEQQLAAVKNQMPSILAEQREKLLKRFTDVKLELDPVRLEQEMVIFAQRIDVTEEIERTDTHLAEIRRILKAGGVVGRRLDFLMQELNRESNTMGSKSVDAVLTHAVVEMKVLIEQMREQIQNIE